MGILKYQKYIQNKFFKAWSEFTTNEKLKLPRVISPINWSSSLGNAKLKDINNTILSSTFNGTFNENEDEKVDDLVFKENFSKSNEKFPINQNKTSIRKRDKEKSAANYKMINKKMRLKIENAKINSHYLFTFDPLKVKQIK